MNRFKFAKEFIKSLTIVLYLRRFHSRYNNVLTEKISYMSNSTEITRKIT